MIALILILFGSIAYAKDVPRKMETPSIAFHYDENNNASVSLGDYNLFNQTKKYYGLRRYGGGSGRIQVGNSAELEFNPNVGIHANGNNGTTIVGLESEERNSIFPHVGLELFNGRFVYNSNRSIQDYYLGFGGASLGVQADILGCRILPLLRGGGTAGNLGKNGILPEFNAAYGYSAHLSCYIVDISYGKLFIHDINKEKNISDTAVLFNLPNNSKIGIMVEHTKGLFEEKSYSLIFKNFLD